jgi:hypothetical protein
MEKKHRQILEKIIKDIEKKVEEIEKIEIAKASWDEDIFPVLIPGIFVKIYGKNNEEIKLSYVDEFGYGFLKTFDFYDYDGIEKVSIELKKYFENKNINVELYEAFD